MSAIFDFFSTLGNAIIALFNFISSMYRDGVEAITLLAEMLPAMPSFWTWLPSPLSTALYSCILIAVTFRVLGWGD